MNHARRGLPSGPNGARSSPGRHRLLLIQTGIAALLAAAGIAHLLLTPEHLGESTLLGIGFAIAGIVQLGLAVLVVTRPSTNVLWAVVAVSAVLIVLYAWNVLVGLPVVGPEAAKAAEHGHGAAEHAHGGGLMVGLGEPIDLAGALTKAAEVLAIIGSLILLRHGPAWRLPRW